MGSSVGIECCLTGWLVVVLSPSAKTQQSWSKFDSVVACLSVAAATEAAAAAVAAARDVTFSACILGVVAGL